MNWTDEGVYHSYGMTVWESEFSRVINYGTEDKPFRLRFTKVTRIGFFKGLNLD